MTKNLERAYVLFEGSSGSVIGTYACYDLDTNNYVKQSPEQIQEIFGGLLEQKSSDEVDIIEGTFPEGRIQTGYRVDLERRMLVPKLQLALQAERTRIQGDGQDSVEIKIKVIDETNKVSEEFNGKLRVTTTRGRLSKPGGLIEMHDGTSSIALTSVPETIQKVTVSVQDPSGQCNQGKIDIEFL